MLRFFFLVMLFCCVCWATNEKTQNLPKKNKMITIPIMRQRTPQETFLNKPKSFKLPYDLKPKPPPDKNDTISVFRYFDTEFYALIGIGKPFKFFKLIIDTAWSNTWVISAQCGVANVGCWYHNKYDSDHSSRYQKNGTKFVVHDNKTTLEGFLSVDDFNIAHFNLSRFLFAEMTDVPWFYVFSKADGVLGMGQIALALDGATPFFYELVNRGMIEKPIFAIFLNRDPSSNRGGNIYLGEVEPRHHKGNFTYVSLTSQYYWQFKMDRVVVATNKSMLFCQKGCEAYVDTGSNVISGPLFDIQGINKMLKAKPLRLFKNVVDRYMVDCATVNKLPTITFTFGNRDFSLNSTHYIQKISWKFVTLCLTSFTVSNSPSSDVWTLGAAFLSTYYTVYDIANRQVGFDYAV